MKVVTTNGTVSKATLGTDGRPLTEGEAKAHAAECNARAEKLGIKTRYEVKD